MAMTDAMRYRAAMQADIELRTAAVTLEEREAAPPVLVGYAATFGDPYPVESVMETIDRSAFDRTLRELPDVFALIGHDQSRVIARTKNGTLRLQPDQRGLRVEIAPVDTQESRDAFALVTSGTIDAMSFGFRVRDQKFDRRNGEVHRLITDVDLFEVSLVAFPANPQARLSQRAKDLAAQTQRRAPFLMPNPIHRI
jgi:HK97 family phage prohead protease